MAPMAKPKNGIFDDHHHSYAGIQPEEILQETEGASTENGEHENLVCENLSYTEVVSVEHDDDDTSIRDPGVGVSNETSDEPRADLERFQYTVDVSNGDDDLPYTVEVTVEDDDILTQDLGILPYTVEESQERC